MFVTHFGGDICFAPNFRPPPTPTLAVPQILANRGQRATVLWDSGILQKEKNASARVSTDLTTEENPSTTIVQSVQNQQNSATLTTEDEGRLKINGEK